MPPNDPPRAAPPLPKQGQLERRASRRSVTLVANWDDDFLLQQQQHQQEMEPPIAELAFFPLPDGPFVPPSPIMTARKKTVRRVGGSSPAMDLCPLKDTTIKTDQVQPQQELESSKEIDSLDSVASSYFSEMGADEIWEDVPLASADAILGINEAFRECSHPDKVNVCVGAYRDEHGKPWVLPSVRQAEYKLLEQNESKEYLPISGDSEFIRVAMEFAYGSNMPLEHLAAVQTLSGTGACRVGCEFLAQFWPGHPFYCPDPTWGNHLAIAEQSGLHVRRYRYYDKSKNKLAFNAMLHDLRKAPDRSIILLHACAHNPSGCDPTIDQWKQIVSLILEKEHVVFFDSAYQGFASGDAELDAQPFRYAVNQGIPILLAQSFAKNFGLYGERTGTLSVVCGDEHQKDRILSELRAIIRPMYSSPPRHGSSIVKTVLMDEALTAQYREECASMAKRIKQMRKTLVWALKEAGSVHDWGHIETQIGMFAFTGLSKQMCEEMTERFSIYLTLNGRISVAGLNDSNVAYVAKAIHAVSDGKSITG